MPIFVKMVLDKSVAYSHNCITVLLYYGRTLYTNGARVMVVQRVKFSSQANSVLLAEMREIAHREGRHFQVVLEEAMSSYIEIKTQSKVRPEFMAHFRASVERNRRLGELLANS